MDFSQPPVELVDSLDTKRFAPHSTDRDIAVAPTPQRRFDIASIPLSGGLGKSHDNGLRFNVAAGAILQGARCPPKKKTFDVLDGHTYWLCRAQVNQQMAVPVG